MFTKKKKKKKDSNTNVRIKCLNIDLKIYNYTCQLLLKYQRIFIIIDNRLIKVIFKWLCIFFNGNKNVVLVFLILNICFLDEKLLLEIEDTISIHLYIYIYSLTKIWIKP
jgi:hypothetical protein